jgi:PAS domain S-box-containing protein
MADVVEAMRGLAEILVDKIEDVVVVHDGEGRIVYWNQAAERFFGYSREEACLHQFEILLPRGLLLEFEKFRQELGAGKSLTQVETVRCTRDGREVKVIEDMIPVKDETDRFPYVIHLSNDPTDVRRKKALETLSNQPQIALTLAHELRNPLEALNNIAYLMEYRLDSRHVPMMKRQLALCESIVSNLLEFTLTGRPQTQHVSLQQILDQVFSLVDLPPQIQIKCGSADGIYLWIDPAQIRQTFLNLFNNAIEAIGDNPGEITIAIYDESQAIRIDVADNGPGMPDSVFKKLFQPLVTTKKKGMGLGLLACKQLIEANRGSISVANTRGLGCTFSISLPKNPR